METFPIISPELNTALIGLLVAMLALVTDGLKRRLKKIQTEMEPNHGSTVRDAIDRTEKRNNENGQLLEELTKVILETRKDIGGVREEMRQLHRTDEAIRERAENDHRMIWQAINSKRRN